MDNKCSKYEGLFVFSDEETLLKHVQECDECRAEYEKMQKVSDLIEEVKPYYLQKSTKKRPMLKAVCAFMLLIFSVSTYSIIENYDNMYDILTYGDSLSAEDLGFPVDSYGFIAVDE